MKHLKLFESFNDIETICKEYGIENWTINPDGTIDVDGGVYLDNRGLTKLPLKFGKVRGSFDCSYNQLTTLEGSPKEVGVYFDCDDNPIYPVYKLFPDHISFLDSLDYNYLRGTNIDKTRFREALDELGIKMPKKIKGYNWI